MTYDEFAEQWDRRFAAAWPIAWTAAYPTDATPTFRESDAPAGNITPPAIVPALIFGDASVSGQAKSFAGWPGRVQVDMWAPTDAAVYWTSKIRPVAWEVIKQLEGEIPGLHLQGSFGAPRVIEANTGHTIKTADVRLLFTSSEEAS